MDHIVGMDPLHARQAGELAPCLLHRDVTQGEPVEGVAELSHAYPSLHAPRPVCDEGPPQRRFHALEKPGLLARQIGTVPGHGRIQLDATAAPPKRLGTGAQGRLG